MPTPRAGEAVIRTLYLSIDPTNRIWMSDMEQYMPPVAIGDVMRGGGIGRVVASNSARWSLATCEGAARPSPTVWSDAAGNVRYSTLCELNSGLA